jgi:hypothetical protein
MLSTKSPKFIIKSYKLVCSSIYICKNLDCVICRNNLNESIIEGTSLLTDVNIGVCGHGFHKLCINEWTKNNNTCPICCTKWISNT